MYHTNSERKMYVDTVLLVSWNKHRTVYMCQNESFSDILNRKASRRKQPESSSLVFVSGGKEPGGESERKPREVERHSPCGGKTSLEGNHSSSICCVTFLVYFLTTASTAGRDIMNSEVAGSILTGFP